MIWWRLQTFSNSGETKILILKMVKMNILWGKFYWTICQGRGSSSSSFLDHISDVHGHFVDLRGVVLLDVAQNAYVVRLHEVDRHTLQVCSNFNVIFFDHYKRVNHLASFQAYINSSWKIFVARIAYCHC